MGSITCAVDGLKGLTVLVVTFDTPGQTNMTFICNIDNGQEQDDMLFTI